MPNDFESTAELARAKRHLERRYNEIAEPFDWSAAELAREAITREIVEQISGVTVWRWLSEDAIKPWQHRSWIFPAQPGDGQKVEHEYERKGALCYLAAWDARCARIFDRCAPKDGIVPFDALVEHFMSQHPYRNAQRVSWSSTTAPRTAANARSIASRAPGRT